jgi:hypothetical protein
VVHQVGLETARHLDVPGKASHRHLAQQLVGWLGLAPGQLGPVLLEAVHLPLHRSPADGGQLFCDLIGQDQFFPLGQLMCRL